MCQRSSASSALFGLVLWMLPCATLAQSVSTGLVTKPTGDGRFPPYTAPRLPGSENPDLNGIWQALVTANIDLEDHEAQPGPYPELLGAYGGWPPGQSIVEGGEIPYQPWALEKKRQNRETRLKVDISSAGTRHVVGDPELKCFMPGVPRATYMPMPFQIVQGSSPYILMTYAFVNTTRVIRMDWEGEAPHDSWMGWSRGDWEGDTLVVDVSGFRPETWFDRAGNFHSDALHVVERYTPITPYHMMYEATIEDPKVFTRPWKIGFPLYRRLEENVQLLEFQCIPFAEDLLFGPFKKQP